MDFSAISGSLLSKSSSRISQSELNFHRQTQNQRKPATVEGSRMATTAAEAATRDEDIRNSIESEKENNTDFQLIKKTFGEASQSPSDAGGGDGDASVHASQPDSAEAPSGQGAGAETPATPPPPAKFSANLTHSQSSSVSATAKAQEVKQSDPLTLDLNGNGIETSGIGSGVGFDINGDGTPERTSFAAGGDGVLAVDLNGNGVIDSGKELFGDQNGAQNGYAELARYDQNGDGWIDAKDPVFNDLVVLAGTGGQTFRVSGAMTLADAGVKAIGVKYETSTGKTSGGDGIAQAGVFVRADGTTGKTADVLFSHVSVYT